MRAAALTVDRSKRRLIAAGLVGVVTLSLAGCAGTEIVASEPVNTPAETVQICESLPGVNLGDMKPTELVEDEHGKYCRVTISDSATEGYLTLDESDPSVQEHGFTAVDVLEAQAAAYKFVAEQAVDSTRLDNYQADMASWLKDSNAVYPASLPEYLDSASTGKDSGIIITNSLPSPTNRTGAPRGSDFDIKTTKVVASEYEGTLYIVVSVGYSISYQASNESIISTARAHNPELTDEAITELSPGLFDAETTGSPLTVVADQNLAYEKGNYELLTGTGIRYSIFSGALVVGGIGVS